MSCVQRGHDRSMIDPDGSAAFKRTQLVFPWKDKLYSKYRAIFNLLDSCFRSVLTPTISGQQMVLP